MITYRHETGERMLRFFGEMKAVVAEVGHAGEMLKNHWDEVADHKDFVTLDPDYQRYMMLVEKNMLVIVSARDGEKMVGYAVIIVGPHLHYRTVVMALEDIHYVDPNYRGAGVGTGMVEKVEEVLTAHGARFVNWRVKPKSDHGAMFVKLGYTPIETIYGKRLG